ncbi:hypothetical protein, partial [Stenotrophomonas muris]|uniref:hypothetical protein n=1 Tax=Stenotrophomonas muris TaxID=2963283 RepID=UPI00300F3CDE
MSVTAGKEKEEQEQRQRQQPRALGWGRIRFPQENGSDPFLFSDTHLPRKAWKTNRYRETVGGGAVWVGRTVGAMDGAIEPPWMGSRRVLP